MTRKLPVLISISLMLLILAFTAVPFIINRYLNNNAERIVTEMFTRTNAFYGHEIKFGKILLDYNYSGTFLNIDNIHIGQAKELEKERTVITADIQKLRVSGFSWVEFLFHNSIQVDTALLHGVTIKSFTPPIDSLLAYAQSKKELKKINNGNQPKDYDLIKVGFFDLSNLSVHAYNNVQDSIRLALNDLDLQIREFELSKEDLLKPQALFSVKDIHGTIHQIAWHFDNYRQYVLAQDIKLDTRESIFTIGYAGILHKLNKYAYTDLFEERKPRIVIDSLHLDVKGFNFQKYFREGIVEADTINASGFVLENFVDKRKKENFQKRPPLIHELFQQIKQPFYVGLMMISNGRIVIEERPDNASPHIGSLFFSEINGSVSNISNIPQKRNGNNWLTLDANAKLMGEGHLQAVIRYDLVHTDGRFTMKGTLKNQPLTSLNKIIEPEAKARIQSGKLNRLDFNIAGNKKEGSGDLIVRFDDLELQLLNQNFKADNGFWRKIGSFLINKLVVRGSNPDKKGNLRKGEVYYLRQQHKSIFHYWWQLIFSGLRSTISGEDQTKLKEKQTEKSVDANQQKGIKAKISKALHLKK